MSLTLLLSGEFERCFLFNAKHLVPFAGHSGFFVSVPACAHMHGV